MTDDPRIDECQTCWTCDHLERIERGVHGLDRDIGVCCLYRTVEDTPHARCDCDDWSDE